MNKPIVLTLAYSSCLRVAVVLCLLIAAVLAVQAIGYVYFDGETARINVLDKFLAQYQTDSPMVFNFLYLREESAAVLTPAQKGRLGPILKQYAPEVYFDAERIPERLKTFDFTEPGTRYFTGYKNGGILTWRENAAYPFYFSASYQLSIGDIKATGCMTAFFWIFSRWFSIWKSCMWINR
jgi:hypothetical protein